MRLGRLTLILLTTIYLVAAAQAATLTIQPGFPQENNYVFVCDAEHNATHYNWNFGDGQQLLNITNNNVYHTYAIDGEFTVNCQATNGTQTENASINVTVDEKSVDLTIAEWYPQNNSYVFICEANGFEAISYDWYYGDGDKLLNITNNNTYHTYEENGTYNVTCSATDGTQTETTTIEVEVNGTNGESSKTLNLTILENYPQNNSYVFLCNAEGFTPTGYNWYYDDGHQLLNITNNNTYHTYEAPGDYTVTCQAFDENTHLGATVNVTIEENETNYYNGTVNLTVKEGYPQDETYVFVCEAQNFEATSYDWHFGDGSKLLGINNSNVYHTFTTNGIYNVTCTAHDENTHGYSALQVVITSINETNEPVHFNVQVNGANVTENETVEENDVVLTWNITNGTNITLLIGNETHEVNETGEINISVTEEVVIIFSAADQNNETQTFTITLTPEVESSSSTSSASSTSSSKSTGGRDRPYQWRGRSYSPQPELVEELEEEIVVDPEVVPVETQSGEAEKIIEETVEEEQEDEITTQPLTGSVVKDNPGLSGSIVATGLFLLLLLGMLIIILRKKNTKTA